MVATSLTFTPIDDDALADTTAFLTSELWEFFGSPDLDAAAVLERWNGGWYRMPSAEGFLVRTPEGDVIGEARLFDLEDPTGLFDIRLAASARGLGFGAQATSWLVERAFTKHGLERLEANTRVDNWPMRATLRRCGFVKEGHHRAADPEGNDWVSYCVLRSDWESGTTTSVDWDDEGPISG